MPEPRFRAQSIPRKILVICGDQYHPAEDVMLGLALAGRSDFQFHQAENASQLASDEIFDAVVLAKLNVNSASDSSPWADEKEDQLMKEFVGNGGGLLVIHAGTVGYRSAPGIREMTGGAFLYHPEACEVSLIPASHPLSSKVEPFTVHDEHYFVETDPGVNVFLTSSSKHGGQPAGWAKAFGNGRICTLTPGHGSSVWKDDSFQGLLHNALHWVSHA